MCKFLNFPAQVWAILLFVAVVAAVLSTYFISLASKINEVDNIDEIKNNPENQEEIIISPSSTIPTEGHEIFLWVAIALIIQIAIASITFLLYKWHITRETQLLQRQLDARYNRRRQRVEIIRGN